MTRKEDVTRRSESIGCDSCGITGCGQGRAGGAASHPPAPVSLQCGCDANEGRNKEGEEIINPDSSVFIIRASPRDGVYPGGSQAELARR